VKPWQTGLCRVVLLLDAIPRYGRLYQWLGLDDNGDVKMGNARWTWQRRGRWGLNLLDHFGLLWRYIDATNPEV